MTYLCAAEGVVHILSMALADRQSEKIFSFIWQANVTFDDNDAGC